MSLTDKIVKGDHLALEIVFDKFFHKLVAFVNSYLHNIEESKDIAQNTLVVFWEKEIN